MAMYLGSYEVAVTKISGDGVLINNQNKNVTPSTSQQSITCDSGYTGLGTVVVYAMPTGTAGTPSASKGTVSNHSISVTPSVTNTTGYITGGTKTGTAITVSASELVSGNKSITSNGTNIDVTNYATVSVSVSSGSTPTIDSLNVTPSETEQTFNSSSVDGYKPVTVAAISSTYVGSGITSRSSSDLTASGATVSVPAGYYAEAASKSVTTMSLPTAASASATSGYTSKATISRSTSDQYINIAPGYNSAGGYYKISAVPNGTEGTPTATKGAVSNHSISVTPSVTNTAGYISGGTKTGTAVTVSASELVSGSQTFTSNNTYDVTNLASVVVNVSGGGGGGGGTAAQVETATATPTYASTSISFTGLLGEPTSFAVVSNADLATGASPWKTAAVVYDGTDLHGQTIRNTSNAQVTYDGSSFSYTYNNGTLTITGSGTNFQANQYKLVYTYGSATVGTAQTQVGSGATSVTFTGVTDEPAYFSCIFKSNFSTSSGYQRVIVVVNDGTSTYGMEMDSSAKVSTAHWSYNYNNGSLTITSQGTNAGGYFHQPGYYQLTYVAGGGDEVILQDKTVSPTESTQYVTADSDYTGLGTVTVNAISSTYVGSGITARSSSDLTASGATVTVPAGYYASQVTKSISTGSATGPSSLSGTSATISTGTNTITLTKTGVTTTPTVSAGYVSSATASTATVALTASVTVNPTPTASGATVTIPAGYYSSQTTKSVTSGSATGPSSLSGTSATVSTGTNTLTLTKTGVSTTPTVSAGYVSSATASTATITLTASVTTKAAATITPGTSNQTIAAGTYLTGAQTIAGDADLVGGNILSTANIFGVQGTVVVQNVYTGSSAPSSSTGSNGDIYIQS